MSELVPHHLPLLAARGLAFMRNEQCVFGPLDFAVDAGEALLVQGDNGVGKTTLLRVLAGLLHADTGEVDIDGRRATALLRASAMSYLGHLPALKQDLSALENLCYVAGLNRVGMDGNGLHYSGDSAVLDFLGQPLGVSKDEEGILTVTLSSAELLAYRTRFPAMLDADAFSMI